MGKGNEKSMKELIEVLMDKWGHTPRLRERDLQTHWEELMGKMISRHTKRLSVHQQKLFLEIDSPIIRTELLYGKSVIIEKVNSLMGKDYIIDVVLR
jgi:predicted nucleic acid-binding Zn ribbon protein